MHLCVERKEYFFFQERERESRSSRIGQITKIIALKLCLNSSRFRKYQGVLEIGNPVKQILLI